MHSQLWTDMFVPALPVIDKILRAIIVYFFLVVALKLAGRRELAQLNAFDLVVLLTVANAVQDAIIGNDNSVTGGLIGAATLLVINYLVVRFSFEYNRRHRHIGGSGLTLIANGHIRQEALKKELITLDELREAASRQGFNSLREIEAATLNQDGSFAFRKKKDESGGDTYAEILKRMDRLTDLVGRIQPAGGPSAKG